MWLLRGDGRGGLPSRTKLTPGSGFDPFEFRRGDFDGDGWPDVLVYAAAAGSLGLWILHGDFPWRIAAAHLGCGPGIARVLEREPAWGWAFSDGSLVERLDFIGRIENGLHECLHVFLGK